MEWSRNIANGIAYYDNDNTHDDAVPVVFIHGVGLRTESWLAQLPAFAAGYHCYALDMPGHGDSALLQANTVTLTDFATAIHGFIQTVIGKPVILVGHSLGAMTALQLAISYPSAVRGVAALNAIYDRPDAAAKEVQRRAQSLLDDLDQDVSERPIARWFAGNPQYQTEADLCRLWLEKGNRLGYARAYQMFAKLRGISATDLQTIAVPALLLTGELDANSSPEMSRRMAELLPNANAVIVPDARHMTQMTHASAVNAALATFFTQCDSPANRTLDDARPIKHEVPMTPIDPKMLRKAFGSFMTGVTVITAMTDDGQPVGFTANSFTSVSLEPPLLLVCPSKFLSSFDVFATCSHFAVNILSEDQQHISNIFAGSKDDRFGQIDWHTDTHGNPIIAGALTHFSCKTDRNIEAGDHHLLVGEVLDFASREGHGLGYSAGGYFSLGMEREAAEISVQQPHVNVGVIIEHEGKVLLSEHDGKAALPSLMTDDNTNAVSTIEQFLNEHGIDAQLGAVFSIYENSKTHNNYIVYRATATNDDTKGLGNYVPIEALTEHTFATSAIQSMMTRYMTESKNGLYGVYVGKEDTGKVH